MPRCWSCCALPGHAATCCAGRSPGGRGAVPRFVLALRRVVVPVACSPSCSGRPPQHQRPGPSIVGPEPTLILVACSPVRAVGGHRSINDLTHEGAFRFSTAHGAIVDFSAQGELGFQSDFSWQLAWLDLPCMSRCGSHHRLLPPGMTVSGLQLPRIVAARQQVFIPFSLSLPPRRLRLPAGARQERQPVRRGRQNRRHPQRQGAFVAWQASACHTTQHTPATNLLANQL